MTTIKLLRLGQQHSRLSQIFTSTAYYNKNIQSSIYLTCTNCSSLQSQQYRHYQRPAKKPGFFSKFIENVKDGMQRDKQMQENLKKFKEEAKEFDDSEAVKGAKRRLSSIGKLSDTISPYVTKIQGTVKASTAAASSVLGKLYKDASESEVFKKGQEVTEELSKSAKDAAEIISEETGKTATYKTASKAFSKVVEDLDDITKESRPYQAPEKLRRRTNASGKDKKDLKIEANEDAQDVVLHKDSKWQQQWKDFRDNNPVVTGIFSLKTKYDESDNVVVRVSRVVTDKLQDIFADVFSQSEQAAAIAEITKIDPSFNKESFLKECEFEIIPTVLEAFLRSDMDVLQDWCHEGTFNVLATKIKHDAAIGLVNASRILDIRNLDLVLAKNMEQGPVLIMTFQTQQVNCMKNKKGDIIEGGIDNIENVSYVWAMCRDQSIFEHRAAWRVLEFQIQAAGPYL